MRRRASPRCTSCPPTRIRSVLRRPPSKRRVTWRRGSSSIRTARRCGCARRSPQAHGLNPANIMCSNGSDEVLSACSRATYLEPGDEGDLSPSTASWSTRSTSRRRARCRSSRQETDERADVDAILAAVTAAHADRLHRQPQQSDRHLPALRGGAAAACRPAASMCSWCSMRPTQNMSAATTMRPASNWSPAPRTS